MNQAILKSSLIIVAFVALLHSFCVVFSLYWIYPESDNVVHLLVGFGLGLLFASFIDIKKLIAWNFGGFVRRVSLVLFVATIAVLWEYIEQVWSDAASDVWWGLAGAFAAYAWIYFKYKKRWKK